MFSDDPLTKGSLRLALRLWLTRGNLLAETLLRCFWAPIALLLLAAALVLFDGLPALPGWLHALILLLWLAAFALATWRGVRGFALPTARDSARRLESDSGLPHRPLSALTDDVAAGDGAARALFLIHQRRLTRTLSALRAAPPHPVLARLDRRGLTAGAALLFVAGWVVGAEGWTERLQAALSPNFSGTAEQSIPPTIDAWITPPPYTGVAPLYLQTSQNEPTGQAAAPLRVPTGSVLLVQVQGGEGAPALQLDGEQIALPEAATGLWKTTLDLFSGSTLAVQQGATTLGQWQLQIVPDTAPTVRFDAPPGANDAQALVLSLVARDDYGLAEVKAVIRRVDDPALAPLELDLSPAQVGETELSSKAVRDLTPHLWAGLAVDITLVATDDLGQQGESETLRTILPQRFFSHPVAQALIELRRELTLNPGRRAQVAVALNNLYDYPEAWHHSVSVALALKTAERRLVYDRDENAIPDVQQLLWDTALALDNPGLATVAQRLEDIQRQLMEALENGASDEELESLMQQLEQAMNEYLEQLAQQMEEQLLQGMEPPTPPENMELVRPSDLQEMLDQMRELAQSGAKEQAQEMLRQLQEMLENLQAMPFAMEESPESQAAQQQLQNMEDMLRRQQELLDRSQMESAKEPSQRSPESSDQAAADQEQLRRDLGESMREMADQMGDIPPEMGNAERSMREAQEALENADPSNAIGPQTEALNQLQQSFQDLAEQLAAQLGRDKADGQGRIGANPGEGLDPLGRRTSQGGTTSSDGVALPEGADQQRARDILDDLRERRSDPTRPDTELDYLDRLLDQF